MAVREALVAVHDEGRQFATGNTRSLLLTGRQPAGNANWEEWLVRSDDTYDVGQGNDFVLGVNLRAGSTLLAGASAAELSGDGQVFDCSAAGGQAIYLDIFGQLGGATPARGTRVPAGGNQRPVTAALDNVRVYTLEVATDGYLLPGAQVADYEASLRPAVPPETGYQPRYTSREEVEIILRAATNRAAGFEANFGDRVMRAIETAELGIDAKLGRTFGPAVRATRSYLATSRSLLQVDDFVLNTNTPIVVTASGSTVMADGYRLGGPFAARNVYSHLRATGSWLGKGDYVSVAADYGFPVPADVRNYAGKYAADILRSDAMRGGLLEAEGAMAYGRTPGKDIFYYLAQYRRHRGM